MLRTVLAYGVALALGAALLQWLEFQLWARAHFAEIYVGLIAAAFMALGVWVGARAFRPSVSSSRPFEHNHRAREALGVTDRELEVLGLAASGRSNKEIARSLAVSPNTIKTHLARLFEKLEASRRTEAIVRARELGLIP